jgi:hypothetical protein
MHCSKCSVIVSGMNLVPYGIHVPVAIAALLMGVEALRHNHVQMILGARHRDIRD